MERRPARHPRCRRGRSGPARPTTWNSSDIFAERGLSRGGVVVVVRPDQYVAAVLPLSTTAEVMAFFAPHLLPGPRTR